MEFEAPWLNVLPQEQGGVDGPVDLGDKSRVLRSDAVKHLLIRLDRYRNEENDLEFCHQSTVFAIGRAPLAALATVTQCRPVGQ